MERRKRKHGKDFWVAVWAFMIIIGLYAVGFLMHSAIWYAICWAFRWAFSWRVSLGVYLLLCVIQGVIWAGRGK